MAGEIGLYYNINEDRGDHFSFNKAKSNNEDDMVYANMEDIELETRFKVEHDFSGCAQRTRTAAVCLGVLCFLLLAVIVGLQVHYSRLTGLHDSEIQGLKTQNNKLQISYNNLTEQFNTMMYANLTAEKELCDELRLKAPVNHNGWTLFGYKWYFISAETEANRMKSWEDSRRHCQSQGAHLVSITSREENEFLRTNQIQRAWIGLSDRISEGTWQWVDGTTLQGEGFWKTGEPNSRGKEDCVEIIDGTWNDLPCSRKLNWICEL